MLFLLLYSVGVQSNLERVKYLALQVAASFHAGFFSAETLFWLVLPLYHLFSFSSSVLKRLLILFLRFTPFILEIGTDWLSCWPCNRTSIQVFFFFFSLFMPNVVYFRQPKNFWLSLGNIFHFCQKISFCRQKATVFINIIFTVSLYKIFQIKSREVTVLVCSHTTFHH